MRHKLLFSLSTVLIGLAFALPVRAHQPYFEEVDATFSMPFTVSNPTISKALYSTLDAADDVDYFRFFGNGGENILLGISIPAIDGQEHFAPSIALMGSGLELASAPEQIERLPNGGGLITLVAEPGEVPIFFEPFSRTRYWQRQRQTITLPDTGDYLVAVWSPMSAVGRYALIIGDREVRGGDPQFGAKLGSYWTAVPEPDRQTDSSTVEDTPVTESASAGTQIKRRHIANRPY